MGIDLGPAGTGAAGTVCPANVCGTATNAYYIAQVSQQGATGVPTIHSEIKSTNLEFNDTIHSATCVQRRSPDSQDTLYGQGLAKANNVAGFIACRPARSTRCTVRIQRHDSAAPQRTWSYNPAAPFGRATRVTCRRQPDARARHRGRNFVAQLNVYFDQNANLPDSRRTHRRPVSGGRTE